MAVKMEGPEASDGGGGSAPERGAGHGSRLVEPRCPLQCEAEVAGEPGLIHNGAVQSELEHPDKALDREFTCHQIAGTAGNLWLGGRGWLWGRCRRSARWRRWSKTRWRRTAGSCLFHSEAALGDHQGVNRAYLCGVVHYELESLGKQALHYAANLEDLIQPQMNSAIAQLANPPTSHRYRTDRNRSSLGLPRLHNPATEESSPRRPNPSIA